MGLVPMAFCFLKQSSAWVQATKVIIIIKAAQYFMLFHLHNNLKEMTLSVKEKAAINCFRNISRGENVDSTYRSSCYDKKSPPPLYQRGMFYLPLEKGGKEGFCKTMSSVYGIAISL